MSLFRFFVVVSVCENLFFEIKKLVLCTHKIEGVRFDNSKQSSLNGKC